MGKGMSAAMNSRDCLIGCTGFVGAALLRARDFAGQYHSANIAELPGQSYDTLVCAAAPATMWAANANPSADKANLRRIADAIKQTRVGRLVLISTIAVLADPAAGFTESTARFEDKKPYGRHRRELELDLAAHFERLHVIRLPALFGPGLKKNLVFDLINPSPSFLRPDLFERLSATLPANAATALHTFYSFRPDLKMWELDRTRLNGSGERPALENALEHCGLTASSFTNGSSSFQFYNIDRLASDIDWVVAQDIAWLNICSEPLKANEISHSLAKRPIAPNNAAEYLEHMRSDHSGRFGGAGPYLYSRETVLDELRAYYSAATAI